MGDILAIPSNFDQKYVKNPNKTKILTSSVIGVGTGGAATGGIAAMSISSAAAAGTAAAGATSTAIPGVLGWLATKLGIVAATEAAASAAAAAAVPTVGAAIVSALPFGIPIATVTAGVLVFALRKKTSRLRCGSGQERLAEVVGHIIFLPVLSKAAKYIEDGHANEFDNIEVALKEIMTKWGYSDKYIEIILEETFESKTSSELQTAFDEIMGILEKMKGSELYEEIPKHELPPKWIKSLANIEVAEFPYG